MDFVQDRQLHRKSRRNRLFCAKPPGPFPRREGERHSEDSLALGGCPQDAVPAPSRLREAGTDADASGGRGSPGRFPTNFENCRRDRLTGAGSSLYYA